jgi:PPOX class probable F420-dependent enzyme
LKGVEVDDRIRTFLEEHHSAVMTTLKKDGTPHVARVSVGLVDGDLQSSGTQDRIRTSHLRNDPRCALLVMDRGNEYHWLGLECVVTIHDGEEAPQLNRRLYEVIAGKGPDDEDEYLDAMVKEKRLVYGFDIKRAYGQY